MGLRAMRALVFAMVMGWTLAACGSDDPLLPIGAQAGPSPALDGTWYEQLDLSSPALAVETFHQAMRDDDFFTASLVVDTSVQTFYEEADNVRNGTGLARPPFLSTGFDDRSEFTTPSTMTDLARILGEVNAADAVVIDLDRNLEIVESRLGERLEPVRDAGPRRRRITVDVIGRLGGTDDVAFRTVQADSGRWRVQQISMNGADFDSTAGLMIEPRVCGRSYLRPGVACGVDVDRAGAGLCASMQLDPDAIDAIEETSGAALAETASQLAATSCEPATVPYRPIPFEWTPEPGDAYAALDLSTQTAAVSTFLDAFDREDFLTLWLVLDPDAHSQASSGVPTGNARVVTQDFADRFFEDPPRDLEHTGLAPSYFDAVMAKAADDDEFIVDLREGSAAAGASDGPGSWSVVEAQIGSLGTVQIALIESASGRWRVRQVAGPRTALEPGGPLFLEATPGV
ncbi:MAG: hypothetical protein ACR2P0_20500 [Acidimicrobiales bacterium]